VTLRGDLPQTLARVPGGLGDVDLTGASVEGFEDGGVECFAGCVGARGIPIHRLAELRHVFHNRKGSTLANGLDNTTDLAKTVGMTNWTRALSMADLYVITSNTTDERERREALAEIERRDEEAGR
jgi:hypothetical protein